MPHDSTADSGIDPPAILDMLATAVLGWSLFSRPDPDVAEGNRLYQEGKYSEAAAAYQNMLTE